jgi:hypothetical protein
MTRSLKSKRKPPLFSSELVLCLCLLLLWHPFEVAEGLIASSSIDHKTNIISILLSSRSPLRKTRLLERSSDGDHDEEEEPNFVPNYTGLDKRVNWKLANPPVPIRAEHTLLKSGALLRRGEFGRTEGRRVEEIEAACHKVGMTLDQGFLIRKQLAVTKVMRNSWRLKEGDKGSFEQIERQFEVEKRTLLRLSGDLDMPPVSILRAIIRKRVEEAFPEMSKKSDITRIVKSIINDEDPELVQQFLSSWETRQMQTAKAEDIIGYSDVGGQIESSKWEREIYKFLDERGINYLTEEDMRLAGSRITPDCLVLDNCVVNGREVRWIDAKNFYGSGLKECNGIKNKMTKQIAKYEAEFGGSGAIVFKHGFSQKFMETFPSKLFLDSGPLPFGN